jgi:hypothetical protein
MLTTLLLLLSATQSDQEWSPAKGPLATRWTKEVRPDNAWREYPRPQMVRPEWQNLNGLWDYAIRPKDEGRPDSFDGRILVPFPVESALSGVMKRVGAGNRLWYRRSFDIPGAWSGKRVLLHFGAVDWEATVWVNKKEVGSHRGGYDPFTLDLTDALVKDGKQELVVAVWDPESAGTQARGKQVSKPRGIWYTPTTGIWQTAWLEPVPEGYIRSLKIVSDIDRGAVRVTVKAEGEAVALSASDGGKAAGQAEGKPGEAVELRVGDPKLWSPDSPHLYDLEVRLSRGGKVVDSVKGYFGLRETSLEKDEGGILRLFLNGKPLFQYGLLDQGFWPDGLYTAPTDEALRYDVEVTRKLGFNMARKHVKVEPDRWYYWCDKLGLLVWQDMPNHNHPKNDAGEVARQFEQELKGVIDAFHNHPCIVVWVPFNEGWGQYDTERITAWVQQYDPTRLVNSASGWTDRGVGDIKDIHKYPGPATAPVEEKRAIVLGEFGGLGLPVEAHTWQGKKNWGYRSFKDPESLTQAYLGLIQRLRPMIGAGLTAAVYTQTTDVEIEVNGQLTYDRAIIKMDAEKVAAANRKLYLPPPVVKTLVPTSRMKGIEWRYTTEAPAKGWELPGFDDASWKRAPGGFGQKKTPGAVVRTEWLTSDIWIRRDFELTGEVPSDVQLLIHHDEDAEVYLNGKLAAKLKGFTTSYTTVMLAGEAQKALKAGQNTIAIHCKQTTGGQYIDAGLVSVTESSR